MRQPPYADRSLIRRAWVAPPARPDRERVLERAGHRRVLLRRTSRSAHRGIRLCDRSTGHAVVRRQRPTALQLCLRRPGHGAVQETRAHLHRAARGVLRTRTHATGRRERERGGIHAASRYGVPRARACRLGHHHRTDRVRRVDRLGRRHRRVHVHRHRRQRNRELRASHRRLDGRRHDVDLRHEPGLGAGIDLERRRRHIARVLGVESRDAADDRDLPRQAASDDGIVRRAVSVRDLPDR
jgi:hypothetical protein